jgi:ABC-type transporter Mla maintaining outer membrane lipid asymmetry ATPase subunit MlaF
MHNLNLVQIPTKDKRPSEISGGMKQRVGLRVRFYGAECCCSTSP